MAEEEKNILAPEESGDDAQSPGEETGVMMVDFDSEVELGNVSQRPIVEEMEESYLSYAMSVIVSRALPDVRDGLKPVHRRILYAMQGIGLRHNVKFKKSANVVGEVLGKYHPHGDTAVYEAMVRMAQDFSFRYPLVQGQGNFGSIDGDNAAAMRYTEARMQSITEELLRDLDKDTVDFGENYDASRKEPLVLPANIPSLLINGITGIAVGMATNIPPHNLSEVIDAFVYLVDNPDCEIKDLMQFIKGPDFPTGGVSYGGKELVEAYHTGRGKVTTRAVATVSEMKNGRPQIIITEIPYMVNKSSLVEKIADLVSDKKIVGIADLRDESTAEIRIVIELKRDSYPKKILNQLYKMTQMQVNFNFNMIALVDGIQPRLLNLKEILSYFQAHREEVIVRRTQYELRVAEARLHILEGLKIALDHIDAVIKTIRASATKEEAHENLMKKFKLSDLQTKAILDMRLQTLAGLESKKIEDEYNELKKLVDKLKEILEKRALVLKIVKDEILAVKEAYGDDRRTKMMKSAIGDFSEEDLIPDEPMIVTLTQNNYIKRIEPAAYRAQHRGGQGVAGMGTKDDDSVAHLLVTRTHHDIMFFTDRGRVFRLKTHEIPQVSRTAKGQALVNLIQLSSGEKVTAVISLDKERSEEGYLVMATVLGTVKKTALVDFKNVRASGLIAIKIRDDDELGWVRLSSDTDDMMLITEHGQSIRFTSDDIRPMGRASQGVRGIRLKGDDRVVQMIEIQSKSENYLLTLSQKGYGKMTRFDQFRVQNRGGSGIKAAEITTKTGNLIGSLVVLDMTDDVIMISQNGVVLRTSVSSISTLGRATQGVRVMKMKDGDVLSSFALYHEIAPDSDGSSATPEKGVESKK